MSETKGLTLPIWVVAAACAATQVLLDQPFTSSQRIYLPGDANNAEPLYVPVTSSAMFAGGSQAIAINHCEPGLGLDLTRGLEIWTCVQWQQNSLDRSLGDELEAWLYLVAGAGVGTLEGSGEACLSGFARQLLIRNLRPLIPLGRILRLEIIFPRGKELAARTSNKAFGVVDGLALIGTQAETQDSASPQQLQKTLDQLRCKSADFPIDIPLTFVLGENGLDLALKLGINSDQILKVGNWLGPLLVAAAEEGVGKLLLFGYHGKLVKLAGGIFHTHHHLADARLEVITALAVNEGLPLHLVKELAQSDSLENAFLRLESRDPDVAKRLWNHMALAIEKRSADYVRRYGSWTIQVGVALFDRQRQLRWAGPFGQRQLSFWDINLAV